MRQAIVAFFVLVSVLGLGLAQSTRTSQPASLPAGTYRIVTIDNETFDATGLTIAASQATFTIASGERKAAVRDLWIIRLGAVDGDVMAKRGQKAVVLSGPEAQPVSADDIAIKDGKLSLSGGAFAKITADLSALHAIYLPAKDQTPDMLRRRHLDLKLPVANADFIMSEDKNTLVPAPGIIKELSAGRMVYGFQDADRTADLAVVRAIQLAPISRKPTPPTGVMIGRDGSILPFAMIACDGKVFTTELDTLAAKAPLSGLAEIRLKSDRIAYLSDLEPAKVTQCGMFDTCFPYRKDFSAAGGSLRLGKTIYPKGLGLHSRCELTYKLPGEYSAFAATVGIDAVSGNRGNAVVKLQGDGKDLIEPITVVGGGEPLPIRCDMAGVKELTIIVELGADGTDVGDNVDLVEARVIRK